MSILSSRIRLFGIRKFKEKLRQFISFLLFMSQLF